MQRPNVIGVRRVPPREPAPTEGAGEATVPLRWSMEAVYFASVGVCALLAALVWWRHGGAGPGLVLVVPFFLVLTPVLAWWQGHGVLMWDRSSMAFDVFAADASAWRAQLLLAGDMLLTAAIPVFLMVVGPPTGG